MSPTHACGAPGGESELSKSLVSPHMNLDLFYAFTVAFVGATLFLLVDKYEREGPMAHLLKFLVLFVAGVAILHKLQPMFGVLLF